MQVCRSGENIALGKLVANVKRVYLKALLDLVPVPVYGSVQPLPPIHGDWQWQANKRTVTLRVVGVQWHPALPAPRLSEAEAARLHRAAGVVNLETGY